MPDSNAQWWKSAVVYQIYPRSFADSNGDGIGDLGGIHERLDYLAKLGVDVIWLSPIYPSPQDDNGYDISNYQDIDPTFGTLDQFDSLLTAVHERGMKLVMDLVVNHTSDEHPWFVESRSSKDSPKRDWYWWRDAREGAEPNTKNAEPTNWTSFFSGPTWEWDEVTEQYYLHLFSKKQPDLNWENEEVRQAIYEMMRWWLDRGVDGFRMDVINLISKNLSLPDAEVEGDAKYGDGSRFYICGPRIHEFLQEMHEAVFAGRDAQLLTVGETPGATVEDARLFTGADRKEVDMVFQFEHMSVDNDGTKWNTHPMDLRELKEILHRWQEGLAESGWNSLYWNNHDQPRAVSRFGDDGRYRVESAKMLGTVLHLQRGTPYVYEGEELGMTNSKFETIDDFEDLESINYHNEEVAAGRESEDLLPGIRKMSRDNARTPMQWDSSPNAGFTTGTPWISVTPNYSEINAESQVDDPESVFSYYRSLIDLRHTEPAVAHGDMTMLLMEDENVFAFTRQHEGAELLVLGNFSSESVAAEVDAEWASAEWVLSNYPTAPDLELRPWEARVYRRAQ